MKKLMFLSLLLSAAPAVAQNRVDLLIDVEGVRPTGGVKAFAPGVQFVPRFDTGGGIGVGLNWFLGDRVSVETKIAGVGTRMHLRIVSSDSIHNVDLGNAQLYPISAMLQWHLLEGGAIRPYVGAGAVYTLLRDIEKDIPLSTATGIEFRDPFGLVVGGGLEWNLSKQWSLYGDARYVPMETEARATFRSTTAETRFNTRPLIISTGISFRLRR
jgi:outer membrane protein W